MAITGGRPDISLTPDEQAAFLRENRKCALATLDKDGFPHLVAMTFYEKDGAFWMTSYGKAQKVLNIRRDPKVGLMIESGEAYGELRGVMVRGTCELIEGPEAVEAVFIEMAQRRNPSEPRPTRPAAVTTKRVVLKVVPHKIFTWDHRKLGGRY
jgi:PPOX class probable F420-dependent enzyme